MHANIDYPFAIPPEPGTLAEVAPGILWTRIALPFQLDHVNVYLIDDGDGWAVLDTGIDNPSTRSRWEELISGPLAGRRLTRLVVTHHHPDHIGLAGWLCRRFDIPLYTTQTAFLSCLNLSHEALDTKLYHDFYFGNGLDVEATKIVSAQGHKYLQMVSLLPPTFARMVAGDTLRIGQRLFRVITGEGHAPEQAMLYSPADRLLFAADQVLAKISPNVSVWAVDPNGDPLGLYLRSLRSLRIELPEDTLVLPGHQLPFYGLHARSAELSHHHALRCELIAEACTKTAQSVADLVPIIFRRSLDPHQLSFAFGEALAHVNYMLGEQRLSWGSPRGDVRRVVSR